MKKVKIFPAPHVELRVHVSDEMVKDMHICRKKFEQDGNGGNCCECSWGNVQLFDSGMCELSEVIKQVMKMEVRDDETSERT